jgi:pantoate--beta-alanine ligase
MQVVTTFEELCESRNDFTEPFGLVPTMGFLHEGHLSLVRRARGECASLGVSIFVNPTQFGPDEDLDDYPRDLDADIARLEREDVDLLWAPAVEELYPPGARTCVEVEDLAQPLEGARRPGHFRGVTTVVAKLFNAFQPHRAYFGQKDAQQAVVIHRMAEDMRYPLKVVICPTVRESDGLAMSSRNSYLSSEDRVAAGILNRALSSAADDYDAGEREAEILRAHMLEMLGSQPLARTQYVSVADPETLEELHGKIANALLSMAVFFGDTRLIDNIILGRASWTA